MARLAKQFSPDLPESTRRITHDVRPGEARLGQAPASAQPLNKTIAKSLFGGSAEPEPEPAPPSFNQIGVDPDGNPVFSFVRDGVATTTMIPSAIVDRFGGTDLAGRHFLNVAAQDMPAVLADLMQQTTNLANVEAGREAGRGYYDQAATNLSDLRTDFENDPIQQYIMEELQRRSGPGYSLISPEQEASLRLGQSGNVTRAKQQYSHSLAQSGLGGSGIGASINAMLSGVANRGGLEIQANVAAQNQSARDAALASLGRMDLVSDQFLADIARSEANLGVARAQFEADVPVTQTDFFRGPALGEARQQFESEREALEQIYEQLKSETATSFGDLATRGMQALGAGVLSNPAAAIPFVIGLVDDFVSMQNEAQQRAA